MKTNLQLARFADLTKYVAGATLAVMITSTCTEAKAPVAILGQNHSQVKLEVAATEQEITRGLMYRTSMPEDAGMVFLFDPPRPVNFWMYHTLIPLDMIFVKNNKVVKIFENAQPCKSEKPGDCQTYPAGDGIEVTEVVEVNGGYSKRHGLKEGDPVLFTLHPERTVPSGSK